MLKSVIFDMDGVIIDSEPQHARAAVRVYKSLGVDTDTDYCQSFIGSSTRRMAETSIVDFKLDISTDDLLAKMMHERKVIIKEEGYIPLSGVKELIKALYHAGIRLAIASSSSPAEIEDTTKALGIHKYFDKLVSSSSVKHPKPAPDTFELALSKLGDNKDETLVIEDSAYGIAAAKSAGITCIGLINPASGQQDLSKADMLIETFENISVQFLQNTLCRAHGKPITIASTKRLIIRELAVSDVKDIYPIYQDPDIRKYIDNIDDYLENEMDKQRAYIKNVYSFYGYGLWGVFSKTTHKLIGRCGFENHVIDGNDEIMISYLLDSQHWGYGYALECCKAALTYAKEELDLHRVVAVIDHDNTRSINTALNLGFTYIKNIQYNKRECALYSINL